MTAKFKHKMALVVSEQDIRIECSQGSVTEIPIKFQNNSAAAWPHEPVLTNVASGETLPVLTLLEPGQTV